MPGIPTPRFPCGILIVLFDAAASFFVVRELNGIQ